MFLRGSNREDREGGIADLELFVRRNPRGQAVDMARAKLEEWRKGED